MTIRVSIAGRNAALDAVADLAGAGGGPAILRIYTGGQPANADTAASGTLLATFTLASPAFAAASGGVLTYDADPDITTTAVATGAAGYARLLASDFDVIYDGSVGTSGTDFIINTTSIVTGSVLTLASAAITFPV